ncbi:UPF0182 family protein [Candidatus Aenigmatarchaeota archaeon]
MGILKGIIIGIIILFLLLVLPALGLYGDLLWFESLGYSQVFWNVLGTKLFLGFLTGIIFFAFMFLNLKVIKARITHKQKSHPKKDKMNIKPLIIVILFLSLIIGAAFSSGWDTYLKYSNKADFGVTDPVFGNDVSFYVFTLPFYTYIMGFVTVLVIFSLIVTVIGYLINSGFVIKTEKKIRSKSTEAFEPVVEEKRTRKVDLSDTMKNHLSFLIGIFFIILGVWFYLQRFFVLFSTRGVAFGASYTDIAVSLPFFMIISVVSVIVGILFFINTKTKKDYYRHAIGVFIVVFVIGLAASGVVQGFIVQPNEFNLEKPYIEKNVEYTLKAYDLEGIEEIPYSVVGGLSKSDIEKNNATISNIRLLDWRPLLKTNDQIQVFRTYYDFSDVDIDRYYIDGEYRQVMLSPRELNQRNLDSNARTWVNQHLVYTHGYGLTMSPVNTVSGEGLPVFYVKDIPPKSDFVPIEEPGIYFGEQTDEFIITKTTTEELDYPEGDTNAYTIYEGPYGIALDGINKLVYALKFGSIELLVSGSMTSDSKILYNRDIHTRVNELAPFLAYDSDPYMVVASGKQYWIYDAYTVTDAYPYSQPFGFGVNYIRNSVKVVIDAYTGETIYYIIESDPIIETYRNMFPVLFKDFSELDEEIKQHIRYPEDLFVVQANIYATYHMKDPRVFYNKEDVWNIPNEVYRNTRQEMEPYYIIMKLPDHDKEEFIMMMPFTPRNKDNMIGWMAAKSDFPNYGEKIVYTFSKQELIYGPLQIEARIDQDTDISQLITLWNQGGSEVIRGNLLVIPIENNILYVEPLYLQASETGLPQLKRVIVALGDKISMKETLMEALSEVIGERLTEEQPDETTGETSEDSIEYANQLYEEAQELLRSGDLAGYANKIETLGEVLSELL